ncbi:MAG: ribonuclease HII [Clostridiales bacterium]|jgi:ribonuclease HII|nr:ribonuclease HII [Clostridiales bacterium]
MTDTNALAEFDRKYAKGGAVLIAGCDEAGRGPLAGPVSCAAVIMPLGIDDIIDGVDDSKRLSEKKREELYELIIKKAVCYSSAFVSHGEIDKINILNATKKGMLECCRGLTVEPGILLSDAVDIGVFGCVPLIRGDAKSYNIACASIVAKVGRDRLMRLYDGQYPGYGFAKHKGYGTAAHYAAIERQGICEIHRKTFLKGICVQD